MRRKLEGLKDTRSDISAAMDIADEELEVWEKLQEDHSAGQTVFKPKPKSQKRKRVDKPSKPRKKMNYADPDTDDDFVYESDNADSDAGSDYASSNTSEDQGEPLTEDDITTKVTELRITKKEGRHERSKIDEEIKTIRRQIEENDKENESIDALLSGKCISGRNEYSRGAIRQDYASGIRELDQELAEEADAANFNPEVDARDYDEVARNLPVFCVSSRAYQKLKGRLPRDKMPPGFNKIDETEVPALQAHCVQLTTADRQASCRRFLNSMFQLLNSLRLWATNDGTGKNLSEGQLQREAQILKEKLTKLDSALEKTVANIIDGLAQELQDKVYDAYPSATAAAKSQANDTSRKWGLPVNRDNRPEGGLYWATYKAVVRREGCFTGSGGCHNFNEQLVEPVIRHIAGPWESVFARRMPGILNGLPLNAGRVLTDFHNDIERRAVRNGASIASFQMLKHQIPVYKETLKDAMTEARGKITEKQRDINREFEPQISAHMLDIYDACTREAGPGSFARRKANMDHHVADEKESMFDDAVNHIRGLLKKMLSEVKDDLLTKLDAIYIAIKRDYTGVVVGQEQGKTAELLPREQRAMRKAILDVVDGAETIFKRALEGEPTPEPQVEQPVKQETLDEMQQETSEQVIDAAEPPQEVKSREPSVKEENAAAVNPLNSYTFDAFAEAVQAVQNT